MAQALIALGSTVDLVVRRLDDAATHVLSSTGSWPGLNVRWLGTTRHDPAQDDAGPARAASVSVPWAVDARETVHALQSLDPAWVVVDHYAFDARWHHAVRGELRCRLLVIDDLADRAIEADLLLDQNWVDDHRAKYLPWNQLNARLLAGPRFSLLAPSFRDAPRYRFRSEVKSIGIFMGGTDPEGASGWVLATCRRVGFRGPIEVVSTSANRELRQLEAACSSMPPTTLTLDEPDLAAFFARHDLQIGAGGGAVWERCCIGAPSICLVLAPNQMATVPPLHRLGVLHAAALDGRFPLPDSQDLGDALTDLLGDPSKRQAICERAATMVDGRGAQRVALCMLKNSLQVRAASMQDAQMLHRWRDHPSVRANSYTTQPIPFEHHLLWLQGVLADDSRTLMVGAIGQTAIGSVRFDRVGEQEFEVSIVLDPDLRGMGLGEALLARGEEAMCRRLRCPITVLARVRDENQASQRLFRANGYHGGPLLFRKSVTCQEPGHIEAK